MGEVFERSLTGVLGTLRLYCEYLLSDDLGTIVRGPMPRTILRAPSGRDDGLSYSELAKKISYPMSNLPKYVRPLIDTDLIIQLDGRFVIRDRILREYLRIESEGMF